MLGTLKTTSLDLYTDARENLSEADVLPLEAGIFLYTERPVIFSLYNSAKSGSFTSIIDWPMQKKNNNVQCESGNKK